MANYSVKLVDHTAHLNTGDMASATQSKSFPDYPAYSSGDDDPVGMRRWSVRRRRPSARSGYRAGSGG